MIRILYVCSILQEDPILLPVPPIAGGAPPWNVFRLAEAVSTNEATNLEITVVSACETSQLMLLKKHPHHARYLWHVVREHDRTLSRWLSRNAYAPAVLRRLVGTPSWLAFRYMQYVRALWMTKQYDLLILDDAPQNLGYLRRFIPRDRLLFTFRGQIGCSRAYLADCGGVISTNSQLTEYIESVLPSGKKPPLIFVVPNSLDSAFASGLQRKPTSSDTVRLVFVGRIVPDKGVRELVVAFREIVKKHRNANLTIVGASKYNATEKTPYEMEIESILSTMPEGSVELTGYVPNDQIGAIYCGADMAVFPSIWVEGFGMVALEAMRCGLPVIVSDRPGFRSFIVDGHNGIIVRDPADSAELASAISDLIEHPEKREYLAKNGYRTSLQFSPEASALAFAEAIAEFCRLRKNQSY